jgi:hypothetical protein
MTSSPVSFFNQVEIASLICVQIIKIEIIS